MKNLFKSLAVTFLIIFSATTQAQTKPSKLENSLLWEVSGNGLTKPSYLYGTIHMICGGDYFLSDKAKKAFAASEKLVLEIDLSDPKEMTAMQQMAMGKEPLDKTLTPEQLSKLDVILKKTTGMTVQQVNSFSLTTVMSLIFVKTFGCNDIKLYEMEFITLAKNRNLKIAGLETVKSQFEILENAYTNDEMLAMLSEASPDETVVLVDNYKKENIEEIYKNTTSENLMNENTKNKMVDQRNKNWVTQMPELMKQQPTFFAVGAAHLSGEEGVIKLLRKAGYTVKPVTK